MCLNYSNIVYEIPIKTLLTATLFIDFKKKLNLDEEQSFSDGTFS